MQNLRINKILKKRKKETNLLMLKYRLDKKIFNFFFANNKNRFVPNFQIPRNHYNSKKKKERKLIRKKKIKKIK